ncbi:hypothetical protein ECPA28_1930, partial [Escherichia coli PA28]
MPTSTRVKIGSWR